MHEPEHILSGKLLLAATYAAEKHKYLRRNGYDRLPYINHLLKVTDALWRIGGETDPDLLVAALLHDVLEDTDATHEELSRMFGGKVADTVAELTDDMSLPHKERKLLQYENANQLSVFARKIRIVDKASNLEDIMSYPLNWTLERKRMYIETSEQIVSRIRGTSVTLEQWFDATIAMAREKFS